MSTTVERPPAEKGARAPAPTVKVHVPPHSLASELRAIRIVWRRDLIRFANDRIRIVSSLIQPLLFLFVHRAPGSSACPLRAPTESISRRSSTPASCASR